MPRGLVALILSVLVANAACTTPVAVGAMVAGGGSLAGAKLAYKEDCSSEGCVYGNLLAAVLVTVGVGLFVGGAIGLALERNSTE